MNDVKNLGIEYYYHKSQKGEFMAKAQMHGESEREGKAWGQGKFANMPTDVKMDMYPKASEFGPGDLNDTMVHVDNVQKQASSKSHRYLSGQH